jgi:hypothetical protein
MERRPGAAGLGDAAFYACAGVALALHAFVLARTPLLTGGADLLPHLRLIELMAEAPALRNVYAPAYHALGALVARAGGLALYPHLFAFAAALVYVAGFRAFQRGAGLPAAASALFALSPYAFALTGCLPKTEAAGYGLALWSLGCLVGGRWVGAALGLAATFWVHTASAIFLGMTGGIWALARREPRALAALAAGTLGFGPLLVVHLAAGCSFAQALMLSEDDYLRATARWSSLAVWDVILLLASPLALGLAALGARPLWERDRALALTCGALVGIYLNELWLSPFAMRTALDLARGLSVLAVPVAVAGGMALARRPRATAALLVASGLWAVLCVGWVVPRSCHVRTFAIEELRGLELDRCTFRWRGPAIRRELRRPAPVER